MASPRSENGHADVAERDWPLSAELIRNEARATSPEPEAQSAIDEDRLLAAAKTGNPNRVRSILGRGQVNVNETERGAFHFTALHHAAVQGNVAVMRLLVNCDGIDLDAQDLMGRTALTIASMKGDAQIVRLLLDRRADVLTPDSGGLTALHYAVEENHAEVVGLLLSHDPQIDVFAESNDGETPWEMAFSEGKLFETWNKDIPWMLRSGGRLLGPSLPFNIESPPELRSPPSFRYFQMLVQKAVSVIAGNGLKSDLSDPLFVSLEIQILLSFVERLKRRQTIDPAERYRSQVVHLKEQVEEEYARSLNYNDFKYHMKEHLKEWENDFNSKPWRLTLLHVTVYFGFDKELTKLLTFQKMKESINSREQITEKTALDLAVSLCNTNAVTILLQEKTLSAAEVGVKLTPLEIAVEMRLKQDRNIEKWKGIEGLLTERKDVKRYVDNLYRDRQVYVDAANAILLGAALIASVTFAGWLQPPLGYTTYYQEFSPYPAPPGTTESFVGVEQHLSIRVFWAFNSLSFFSAIAAVVAGAATVLPSTDQFINKEVQVVRRWLMFTSTLLTLSISCVLGAFTAAGFAALPPIEKYRNNMVGTTLVGLVLCVGVLFAFLHRLYGTVKPWLAEIFLVYLMFTFRK